MIKKLKIIVILLLVFSLLVYIFYRNSIYKGADINTSISEFSISKGEGVSSIVNRLFEENLISSKLYLRYYLWEKKLDKKIQSGKYQLSKNLSPAEIIEIFVRGDVIENEKNVKIIEGWNLLDIAENFEKNNISSSKDFLSLTEAPVSSWVFEFEKPSFLDSVPRGHDLEGYIYPDTYRVYNNASVSDIVFKALNNLKNKADSKLLGDIEKSGMTFHEVMTLASIIEKEVRNKDDMKTVSGILIKRMNIGMRLEVDSTINYITGKNDPGASYKDLEIDSPYNTYKNYGLPPGPICNPGIEAIKAAVYPKESDFLFYLNRQDTFETIFSKNYDEHLRNKAKYLN